MCPQLHNKILFVRSTVVLLCGVLLMACEATTDSVRMVKSDDQQTTVNVAGKLSAGIRPVENIVLSDQAVEVLFYLANNTEEPIEILPWATPLERPLTADVFVVTFNGEAMPYVGRVVKRAAPTAADYITLQAGDKIEAVVNVSQGYDMRGVGDYQITLEQLYLQNSDGEVQSVIADSSTKVSRQ